MRKHSPEKWEGMIASYKPWWESLSIDEKRNFKLHYEKVREWNSKRPNYKYPNMYDTTLIRLSQLSDKQIYRIWVFKDHPEN